MNHRHRQSGQYQSGLSLVEVLVSVVISLFLLGGIVQVYVGSKTTFRFTNAMSEIQENGRYAMEIITQDLRLSSVWGCVVPNGKAGAANNINNTLTTWGSYDVGLHDFTENGFVSGTEGDGLNNSDSITIIGGKSGQANVELPFRAANVTNIVTTAGNTFATDDLILVARCGANNLLGTAEADIHRITSITNGPTSTQRQINLGSAKSQQFGNDAVVIELQNVTYTIEENSEAGGSPTLWRTEFVERQELIEGIEQMQILFGIDIDKNGFPNQYVTSDNVTDFNEVVAVRIMLLLHSLNEVISDEGAQTYTFNKLTTTAADKRIRQVFSTTVALRNRIGLDNE